MSSWWRKPARSMSDPWPAFSEIWVCFELPRKDPPAHAVVLSFMAPGAEAALEQRCGTQVVSGRALVDEVRSRGRSEYLQLIARLGSSPCLHGQTLRQVLQGPGEYSRWWFLDVTEKDCLWDQDAIYVTILQLMAVQAMKDKYLIERVHLHGSAPALAAALSRPGALRASLADLVRAVALGLFGRLLLLVEFGQTWWTLRRLPLPLEEHRDVLLQGYWDWTVRPDGEGQLRDRYFTTLPARLADRGVSVGWLASCEPLSESWQRGRRRRDVLAAAGSHPEVTLLERHLTLRDLVATTANLRYPVQITRAVVGRAFRQLCVVAGFDLYPLVRRQILRAAWGRTFCRLQLVATATTRACQQRRPRMVLAAFELFLRARAFYAGIRACVPRPQVWAAQHAVYSHDKTFGLIDPGAELRGEPDGCPMPAPDGVFGLGDLSRQIWEANGFRSEQIVLTGGLRYQAVGMAAREPRAADGHVSLLLAGGMCDAAHIDLCDAAVAAAAGLPVRLYYRDHPIYMFTKRKPFRPFRGSIAVTSGTLDEDFRATDLVLFSQTGIAEEALLRGIPTWQWLWPGCNTSPFLDVPVIPAFTSVAVLRRQLEAFVRNPGCYRPTADVQRRVLSECFGPDPAAASGRMADAVHQILTADAGAHA